MDEFAGAFDASLFDSKVDPAWVKTAAECLRGGGYSLDAVIEAAQPALQADSWTGTEGTFFAALFAVGSVSPQG